MTARMAVQFNGLIEWQPGWLSGWLACWLAGQKKNLNSFFGQNLNSFLQTNSKNFRKFSNWYHLARRLTSLKIFRKFSIWYHPGAQKHTSPASEHGFILVWVVPVWKFSENSQTGKGSADSKPVQKLPPPRFGPKSKNQILKCHNSSSEIVTFDDTRIFDTVLTWSTF